MKKTLYIEQDELYNIAYNNGLLEKHKLKKGMETHEINYLVGKILAEDVVSSDGFFEWKRFEIITHLKLDIMRELKVKKIIIFSSEDKGKVFLDVLSKLKMDLPLAIQIA